jgi:hypothetical protein
MRVATPPRRILQSPEALKPMEILSVGRAHLDKQILPSYGIALSPPAVLLRTI